MATLSPAEWRNPYIFSHNEEYATVHTLVATKVETGQLHYYEVDTDTFEPLNLPNQ